MKKRHFWFYIVLSTHWNSSQWIFRTQHCSLQTLSLLIRRHTTDIPPQDHRVITTLPAITSVNHFQTDRLITWGKSLQPNIRAEVCWWIYKDIVCKEQWWVPNIRCEEFQHIWNLCWQVVNSKWTLCNRKTGVKCGKLRFLMYIQMIFYY